MDTTPLHTGDLPPLDLYMDQVLAMLEERFQSGARQPGGENHHQRPSVNNYSKARLLQKPVGKKYTPEHLLVIAPDPDPQAESVAGGRGTAVLPPVRSFPGRDGATSRGSPCPA